MPFQKGHKLGRGREKGSKNRRTLVREAIGQFVAVEGIPGLVEIYRDRYTSRPLKVEIVKYLADHDLGKASINVQGKIEHHEILSPEHLKLLAKEIDANKRA